ncbi:hypothetical protein [Chitinimonas sp. JJ19]|uniref:hypothetical protein n=1 Tax=Chitinimonas sp. JJ19 TaxID=3109352 RepID=UPI003001EB75
MLIIQHIDTCWTKTTRGMPGAGLRNALPEVYRLPDVLSDVPSDGALIHRLQRNEWQQFQPHAHTETLPAPDRYWRFRIGQHNGEITLSFCYDPADHGLPFRYSRSRPIFRLARGQRGIFRINGRFASYSGQYYRQHTLHFAHLAALDTDCFVAHPPHQVHDELAHLF